MLERMVFARAYRCFAAGDALEFRPGLNLLVGDQGTGKSTVLELICGQSHARGEAAPGSDVVTFHASRNARLRRFDFEHDNPRLGSFTQGSMGTFLRGAHARVRSHGEIVNRVLADLDDGIDNVGERELRTFFALDEPDLALSPRSVRRLAATLLSIARRGHQILAAVHNPILIESVPEVLSLEHRRWMPAAEFLASHAAP